MYRIRSGHVYTELHKIISREDCEIGVTKGIFYFRLTCLNIYKID